MNTRNTLTALLTPLAEACNRSHCWIRTPDGPRRIDKVFTPVELSEHVMGGNAYGLCPIRPGESTTRVAVLDLDSHKGDTPWPLMLETAEAIAFTLQMEGHKPQLFRSSGGQGIHIFLMWQQPQDAYSVREMLKGVLKEHGFESGTKGVASKQIEIFPKNNSIPAGGFGSMFLLPLGGNTKSEYLGVK